MQLVRLLVVERHAADVADERVVLEHLQQHLRVRGEVVRQVLLAGEVLSALLANHARFRMVLQVVLVQFASGRE